MLKKPGASRVPEETLMIIERQLWAACGGVQDAVDTIQTDTGVKDKIALTWIPQLIARAREMQQDRLVNTSTRDPLLNTTDSKRAEDRRKLKIKIKNDIQDEVFRWLLTQPEERYKELAPDSRRLRVAIL